MPAKGVLLILNKSLKLIILPTEECNFRCKYCYENFEIGKMNPEVVMGIKNLIKNRSDDLEFLYLDWFGGEPLLAFDIIRDIMEYSISLSEKYNFAVSSGMTTNGSLLTANKHKELNELKVTRFQISFDGDSPIHDTLRVTKHNSGSFDIIYNNLLNFHDSDTDNNITVRMHLNRNNLESVESFLEKLHRDVGNDNRFSILVEQLRKMGGKNDSKIPVINEERERQSSYKRIIEKSKSLGFRTLSPMDDEIHVCYASMFSSYVIRSKGEIGKCTVALYDDKNTIGFLSTNGKVQLDKKKLEYWVRGQFSKNPEQLACPLYSR